MRGNIKGITIQFDADTTKLGNALKKIRSESKGLDQDLRAVNKSLKFNPGNTELLAQKQTLLKGKIEQTKKELDAFKAAQQSLDDQGVDKTSQEYMELRRNIIETESKLKHFNEELKKTAAAKFDELGGKFEAVGDKMQTVGKGLTKYVTAPLVGAGVAASKAFQEVDAGMDIIAQKTGASGKELEAMEESAKRLATTIPTDFETAGAAVGEVNTRFGLTGKALEDLSGQFVKFAQLNNTDVSTSIDLTQKAMEAFGMKAEEAGTMLDILNKAGQDTGIGVDELAQSMVTNAAALQSMGLNAEQSAGFLGQLEKSGVDSAKVMTGLQKALVNGAKAGKSMPQVMDQIQSSIVNAKSDMEATTAAAELFGSKAGPAIANAARNGALDFNALANASMNAAGSVSSTFESTRDPIDKFQELANQMKITLAEVAVPIMEILGPALTTLATKLQELTGKWQSMDDTNKQTIVKVAMVVAALGPLLVVLGKMATGIGAIIKLLPMLGGPVGIAVAAIMALIAVGVALYKNWDTIKKKAGELKDWIVDKWTALKDKVSDIWNGIKDAITKPIEKAKEVIRGIIDKIKSFFSFDFKLPKIKLPHFAIQPPGWKLSDLLHGEIPSLGIDWYAKGGIFRSPSVIGVGEAGAEAVLPIEKLNGMMTAMADSIVNGVNQGLAMSGGGGDIVIPIYLYPSGPKMGEETVKMYDTYKRQLG